jgi:hypothetical protein
MNGFAGAGLTNATPQQRLLNAPREVVTHAGASHRRS